MIDGATGAQRIGDGDPVRTALWIVTLVWVVGMVTVFPLGNDALEAVSVFTFDRLGFLAAAALSAVTVARHPALLRRWSGVETWMVVYLSVVVVAWIPTLAEKDTVDLKRDVHLLLNSFLMPYAAFLIARHCGWTRHQVRTACLVLVFGAGGYLVTIGLIQGLIDWRFLVAEAHLQAHHSRARGPFANAVPYSTLVALLVPITLAVRAQHTSRLLRWPLALICIGLIEAIVFGQVRIVWLATPAALLFLGKIAPSLRKPALVTAAGIGTALVLGSTGMDLRFVAGRGGAAARSQDGVLERLKSKGPAYNRVAVYATSLNMVAHRPLLGFGFGASTFRMSRDDYYASCCGVSWKWAIECAVPHNEILNVLVLTGSVGLIAYLGLLQALWRLLWSRRTAAVDGFQRALASSVLAAFVLLAITAQLHDIMYLSALQVVFFFLAGLAAPASSWTNERTSKPRRGTT